MHKRGSGVLTARPITFKPSSCAQRAHLPPLAYMQCSCVHLHPVQLLFAHSFSTFAPGHDTSSTFKLYLLKVKGQCWVLAILESLWASPQQSPGTPIVGAQRSKRALALPMLPSDLCPKALCLPAHTWHPPCSARQCSTQ